MQKKRATLIAAKGLLVGRVSSVSLFFWFAFSVPLRNYINRNLNVPQLA